MKILALDTSATSATVAVVDGRELLAEYTVNNGNTHSETLLPMIETLLGNLDLCVSDIDLFAASNGPGSFTGVRIGAATLKGLAFGTDKPCVEVSTLEALAYNLVSIPGLICPVMNARRDQLYCALFRSDGNSLTRLMDDSAMAADDLKDKLLFFDGEAVRLTGDGYSIAQAHMGEIQIADVVPRLRHQSAYSVAAVAYDRYLSGEYTTDTQFAVNYLRPSQAEREMNERNKKAEEKI